MAMAPAGVQLEPEGSRDPRLGIVDNVRNGVAFETGTTNDSIANWSYNFELIPPLSASSICFIAALPENLKPVESAVLYVSLQPQLWLHHQR